MAVLERIIGRTECNGSETHAELRPMQKQKLLDQLLQNPRDVKLRVRPWSELNHLDIEIDHPKRRGPDGPFVDIHAPKEPVGGEHVRYHRVLEELRENGEAKIPFKISFGKYERNPHGPGGRWVEKRGRRVVKEWITISQEWDSYSMIYAIWLLTNFGVLLDEWDEEKHGEKPEPEEADEPEVPKPKANTAKAKKRTRKPSFSKESEEG